MIRLCLLGYFTVTLVSALWVPDQNDLLFPTDEELLQTLQSLKNGKRDASSSKAEIAEVRENHSEDSNLLIKTDKREFKVKMQPSTGLVRPGAKLNIYKDDKVTTRSIDPSLHLSHYQGEIEGTEGKVALVRTRNGWRGMIMTENENLFLHDVPENTDGEHLMYEMKQNKRDICGAVETGEPVDVSHDAILPDKDDLSKLEDLLNKPTTTEAPKTKRSFEFDELKVSERSETNREYELEVSVHTDEDMFDYIKDRYPNEDPTQRIQTNVYLIMNMVHASYQSRMIKDKIAVVMTEISIFENNPSTLVKTRKVVDYLDRFCDFDANKNANGEYYDLGILLTGLDIYGNSPSQTGVAGATYTSGMCRHDLKKSCLITEAHGYLSAFAIAHEIGHSLNMSHDKVDNDCEETYLMGPVINEGVIGFSKCSKKELHNEMIFLDDFGRNCMRQPAVFAHSREVFLGRLPGLDLEENGQCIYLFGPGSKDLFSDKKYCSSLTCELPDGKAKTLGYPPIDGTSCGTNKMCYFTKCVNSKKKIKKMNKQKVKPSGLSGKPLQPNQLCAKYVDDSYTYVAAKEMNAYVSLYNWAPMCEFHILCTNGYKFRFLEMPPPVGTPCNEEETKFCKNFQCT